jgi:hypothetical protein
MSNQTTTNETTKLPKGAVHHVNTDGMTVQRVPLSLIHPDLTWNSRSEDDVRRVISTETGGFDPEHESTGMGGTNDEKAEAGLVESILEIGQQDPGERRPNPDPTTAVKWPYKLVAGARRFVALGIIAEGAVKGKVIHPIKKDPSWDATAPTMLAIVKPMTELEARERNLSENTSRNNISPPDLAYGIEELVKAAKAVGVDLSGAEIARRIGKSKAYVSNIMTINGKFPRKVREHWRKGGEVTLNGKKYVTSGPAGFDDMYRIASKTTADDAEADYAALINAKPSGVTGDKRSPETKKFEAACGRASKLGELLGYLAFNNINPRKVTDEQWSLLAIEQVAFERSGKNGALPPTAKQLETILNHLREGHVEAQAALAAPEDGADDEKDAEKAETKRAKRDGGR